MNSSLLAAAAIVTAPQPINLSRWISPDDMPAYHQQNGQSRRVGLQLTVRPDGTLQSCAVENNGGDAVLAAFSCGLVTKRARFAPAKDSDGQPSYGVYRWRAVWAVGALPPPQAEGDLNLVVNTLPKGETSPAYVQVVFAVDDTGHVSSCSAPLNADHRPNEKLVSIACAQLTAAYHPTPAKDKAGNPVASVQNGTVMFTTH